MTARLAILLVAAVSVFPARAECAEIDWRKVDAALSKTAVVSGEVHRYGLPRSDLRVTLDGVAIKPALALGGWVAFAPMHGEAMVMGDLVLLETEITPVMTKLLEGGLDITAIHNHILRASPATFYMHVGGHGDPVKMAATIRSALSASNTPFDPPATTAGPAPAIELDAAALDQIIGVKGTAVSGVYQFGVPPPRSHHGKRNAGDGPAWRRKRNQLSADRQRQGCDHGRFPGDWQRGQPADTCVAGGKHRGDGDPQPYAG